MTAIIRLLDHYGTLCDIAENRRRLALWENTDCGLRGETQWHGVPNYTTDSARPMPRTAVCLEKMWEQILGMGLRRFYSEPEYFLESFLRYKILKFQRLVDDTPLTREIPICFGVTNEAGTLGQWVHLLPGMEPQLAKESVGDENTDLSKRIDFSKNSCLFGMAISFYERVREVVRSSGMSLLLGGAPDLVKRARWAQLVREVQAEKEWA